MPRPKTMPDFRFETDLMAAGVRLVAGVDEVGRGPLAGPVTAAAVILDPARIPMGLNDSKALGARRREALLAELTEVAEIGIGWASVSEIDALNIRNAAFLAMRRAVEALSIAPDHVLVDGNACPPDLPCAASPLVKGDARSVSIAAASIVAKVARDRVMAELDLAHPGYGWATECGLSHAGPSRCAPTSGGDPAP
jgi:ribonuclease HII